MLRIRGSTAWWIGRWRSCRSWDAGGRVELFFVLGVQGSVFGDGGVGVVVVAGEQVDGVGDGAGVLVAGDVGVGVDVGQVLGGDVEQVERVLQRVESAALTADTRPGQAGSAMMVWAAAEPKTVCRSANGDGRPPREVSGVSRVAVEVSSADRRHQSAAAGSSSGSGCAVAAARTRVGRSGRLVAAWARRAASPGRARPRGCAG